MTKPVMGYVQHYIETKNETEEMEKENTTKILL